MGAAFAGVLNALSCHDLYRFVLNDLSCKSDCGEHCGCECETHESSGEAPEEVDVETCLGSYTRKKT